MRVGDDARFGCHLIVRRTIVVDLAVAEIRRLSRLIGNGASIEAPADLEQARKNLLEFLAKVVVQPRVEKWIVDRR